ncbi:hypothetical protein ACX8Z9_05735 [Arthrobacter halodurans]|uniref:Phage shock protein B n=1 Tax=Arthrobacter halodurans TaxID=516699 RepID=A0ABV4UPK3_9MICC
MDNFGIPWFAWIAIAAIIVGCVNTIFANRRSAVPGEELSLQLAENAELNRRLLERLDSLDRRVAGVEKTLSDIPN